MNDLRTKILKKKKIWVDWQMKNFAFCQNRWNMSEMFDWWIDMVFEQNHEQKNWKKKLNIGLFDK